MANEFIIKNGYFSQGDSNITGSLLVSGSIGAYNSGSDVLSIYGSQGNLLVVTDSMSGSLFTITDISGYPILDVTSNDSVNVIGSLTVNEGTYDVVDTFNKVLKNSSGEVNIDWGNRFLQIGGEIPLNWGSRTLADSNGDIPSLDWEQRYLYANDGSTIHIDWSNPDYMNLPNISESAITRILGTDNSGNVYYTSSNEIAKLIFPYTGSAIITGSLVVTGSTISTLGFTGSLQGTASWATNVVTSSYVDLGTSQFLKRGDGGHTYLQSNRIFISGSNSTSIQGGGNSIEINSSNIQFYGSVSIPNSSFSIVTGSVTITTGSVTITTGSVAMPNRPAFRVYGTSATGIPATTTISGSATTVDYNQNNNYNNTTGLFTAPLTGLYHVYYNGRTNSGNLQQVIVYKNRVAGVGGTAMMMWETTGSNSGHFGVSSILNLTATDTLQATVTAGTIQFDGNDNWGAAYIG